METDAEYHDSFLSRRTNCHEENEQEDQGRTFHVTPALLCRTTRPACTLEEMRAADDVARQILQLRTSAGLSQRQLAKLVGTTASVICRLEDADYEGHSLAMLRRIAGALGQRVEIRFVPAETLQTA